MLSFTCRPKLLERQLQDEGWSFELISRVQNDSQRFLAPVVKHRAGSSQEFLRTRIPVYLFQSPTPHLLNPAAPLSLVTGVGRSLLVTYYCLPCLPCSEAYRGRERIDCTGVTRHHRIPDNDGLPPISRLSPTKVHRTQVGSRLSHLSHLFT